MTLVISPPVTDRVSDAECWNDQNLAAKHGPVKSPVPTSPTAWISEAIFPVSRSTSTSANAAAEEAGVVLVAVPRHAHETLPGRSRCRARRHRVDVPGQLVAIINASELDGAAGRLRERHSAPPPFW